MTTPCVRLENVTKLFGRFAALRQVSAEFDCRRIYAVFGPNGAGKSTLLRLMAGLARPTRGRLEVLGFIDLRSLASRLGYMAHASLLYDELDAMENLAYFAKLYGIREPQRCRQAIELVGLDPELKRRVGDYSQGMRQRLSLARAVFTQPGLLLLDEPFSNVDLASAAHMSRLLADLRDQGTTIFVVTHQASHLESVADESLWLEGGTIAGRQPGIAAAQVRAVR